jgi:nicotinamidase-related amidase
MNRRAVLKAGAATVAAAAVLPVFADEGGKDKYAPPAEPALPPSNMKLNLQRTALVVTDPQIDFLSEKGVTWGVVGESVQELKTVENIERLFVAAKKAGIPVAISPHYYYPTDKGWKFEGALEKLMHKIGMFNRTSPYTMEGFEGSGADFMPQYKKYILDGKTIVASPHKVYGPEANDLVLQLRKNTSVLKRTCASSSSRASRSRSSRTPPPPPESPRATATSRRSSTSAIWPTRCGPRTMR